MKRPESWKSRTEALRTDIYALYLAYRDPRVPIYAKALIAMTVAYALSPIDLIPDFIPVIGYVDDLIIIPAGISLSMRMIPSDVMAECRARAEEEAVSSRLKWAVAIVIVIFWFFMAYLLLKLLWLFI